MTTTIEKNSAEEIRISLDEYQGKPLVNIRTYWLKPDSDPVPTRKGITIGVDKLDELIGGLEALR